MAKRPPDSHCLVSYDVSRAFGTPALSPNLLALGKILAQSMREVQFIDVRRVQRRVLAAW